MSSQPILPSFKSIIGIILACILCSLAAHILFPPKIVSSEYSEQFGIVGLFSGILLIDTIPFPGGAIPFITLSYQQGTAIWLIFLVGLTASSLAATIGYLLGRKIGFPKRLEQWLIKRYPKHFEQLHQQGLVGVVALAALPIPISLATWAAGTLGISYSKSLLLPLLTRLPKIIITIASVAGSFAMLSSGS